MKVSNASSKSTLRHSTAASQGDRAPTSASSLGLRVTDTGGTTVYPVRVINVIGGNVVDLNNAEINLIIQGTGSSLTNDDGSTLAYGEVVVIDTAGNLVTTTTAQDTRPVGIIQRSTDDTFNAPVVFQGIVPQINTTGTVNSGDFLETSTSAGLARSSGTSRRLGSFAQALEAGPNPAALMWSPPDSVTGSSSGGGTGIGAHVYNTVAQTIATATLTPLTMDTEIFDTDGFHSTSSNTSRMTIPAGFAGRYIVIGHSYQQGAVSADSSIQIFKNGSPIEGSIVYIPKSDSATTTVTACQVVAGDYLEVVAYQNSGGNRDFGYPAAGLRSSLSLLAP